MRTILFIILCFLICNNTYTQQPVLVKNSGHTSLLNTIDFSSDGKYIVSAGWDKIIKIWNTAYGVELKSLIGHDGPVYSAKFILNNKYIASAADDNIRIWDFVSGTVIKQLNELENGFKCMVISSDGKFLAAGDSKGEIIIYKTEGWQVLRKFKAHQRTVRRLIFSNDGSYLYSAGYELVMKKWNVASGVELYTVDEPHLGQVGGFAVSADDAILYSCGEDRTIKTWKTNDGTLIGTFPVDQAINDISLNKTGNLIAACGVKDGYNIILDATTGKILNDFSGTHRTSVSMILFSKDNKHILTSGNDQTIVLRDINSGRIVRSYKGLADWVTDIDIDEKNQQIVSASMDHTLKLWDMKTGKTLKNFKRHNSFVRSVNFSKDKNSIISASADSTVLLWNVKSGEISHKIDGFRSWVVADVSPTDDYLVAGSKNDLGIWDFKGNFVKGLNGHLKFIETVEYSNDGSMIVSGGEDKMVKVWDVATSSELLSLSHKLNIEDVCFSPDGKYIASSSGGVYDDQHMFIVHEVETGNTVFVKDNGKNMVCSMIFTPDSKFLLVGNEIGDIQYFDLSTGKPLKKLTGHTDKVKCMLFAYNGKYLVSGSADGSCKIWNSNTGELLATRIAVAKSEDYIVFTPDKYYMVSKDGYSLVHFVDGLDFYTFDQFDLRFNRPDIVMDRIGLASENEILAYKKAYEKRLKKMGFDPADFEKTLSYNVPEINVLSKANVLTEIKKKEFTFNIEAHDKLFTLDRLNVDINGVPLYGIKGKSLKSLNSKSCNQTISLKLLPGTNVISVSVINSKGVASLAKKIELNYTPLEAVKSDLYLISVGVSKFTNEDYNLNYASKDAEDIVNQFKQNTDFANIYELSYLDEKATKANILKAKDILKKSKAEDLVVLFVASHGLLDNEMNYYLATHDVDFINPEARGFPYEDLEGLLDGIPARKKLMLIDACHSGEVDKDEMELADATVSDGTVKSRGFKAVKTKENQLGMQNSFELMKELFADLRRGTGAVVISSAGGAEYAFESEKWNNGVFTYALLEGLQTKNADKNKDGKIMVSELRDYVIEKVQQLTNGKQNPTVRRENLEFDFRVW